MQGTSNQLVHEFWPDITADPPSVSISPKATGKAGWYDPTSHHVRLSAIYIRRFGMTEALIVLAHELCHWAAHIKGTWLIDSPPHGEGWRAEMRRCGLDPNNIHCLG